MARTIVGLDIGSSGLRAAEFEMRRRNARLRRFATLPLPEGVVRSGAVVDPEALTEALRDLWSQGKFGTKTVALGIANTSVLVRQMDLDWMPPADFRKALRYQVEDALPIPVDEANLDYHLLEDVEVPGEGEEIRRVSRVLLVAAAREMVDSFVEATHRAGLRTVSVDIVPFALINATASSVAAPGDDVPAEAIVDIGSDTVTVVVHEGGQPRYVRMVPGLGGEVITRALQQRYDWTWDEAERTKIVVGLPGHSTLASEAPRADGLDHPAQQVVVAEVESLVSEIVTTLNYVRGSEGETSTLARVLLAGSGAQLAGFRELLEQRLDTTVEPLTVLDRVRMPRRLRLGEDDKRDLVIPAGLCLGASR